MHSWKDLWNIWTNIYSVRHLIKHTAEFCTLFRTSSLLIDFLTITLASWIKGLSLEEWFSDGQHFFLSAGPTVVMVVCFGEFFKSFLWLLLQCWVTFDIHSWTPFWWIYIFEKLSVNDFKREKRLKSKSWCAMIVRLLLLIYRFMGFKGIAAPYFSNKKSILQNSLLFEKKKWL